MCAVACGPGVKNVEPRQVLVDASNDAAAIEKLLQGSVTNGGLWFDNAECATQFAKPGEVAAAAFPAFARCLAELKLERSTREDALGDVIVLRYGAGYEVEARVVQELSGPRLTWIGYVSRRGEDMLPTVHPSVLEALRLTGDPTGPLDPVAANALEEERSSADAAELTWLRVCIDDAGAVTSAQPYETSSLKARDAFVAAVRRWTFKPFIVAGQGMPVCSMIRMVYPPGTGPATEVIPLPPPPSRGKTEAIVFTEGIRSKLEGKRIAGQKLIAPDDPTKRDIQDSGQSRVTGLFRVCLDDTGAVESALPLRSTGFASYDRALIGAMRQWRYSPYIVNDTPVPICVAITFVYTQR